MHAEHGLMLSAVFFAGALLGLITAAPRDARPAGSLLLAAVSPTADTDGQESPAGPAPAPGTAPPPRHCGRDHDAIQRLDAERAELRAGLAQATARLYSIVGEPHPWSPDLESATPPDRVEEALDHWALPTGAHVVEVDCGEYPCLVAVEHDRGQLDRFDLPGTWPLDETTIARTLVGPARDDQRWQTVLAVHADDDVPRSEDLRTQWRAGELAGIPL